MRARIRVGLALLALSSTSACREEVPRATATARSAEPVQIPETLLATWVVPAPQRTYDRLRGGAQVGQALPFQFPVALSRRFGLPPTVSGRFSTHAPVFGALGLRDGVREWAVGFEVQSGRELVAELSTGASARFEPVVSGEVTLLRGGAVPLAVVDRRLVVASSEEALVRYSVLIARGLSWDPNRVRDVDLELRLSEGSGRLIDELAGALTDTLESRFESWLVAEGRARGAPDFVDPKALSLLASESARVVRSGVRRVVGGTVVLRAEAGEALFSGTLRVEPAASGPPSGASCETILRARAGVAAAILVARGALSGTTLDRIERALAVPEVPVRGARPVVHEFDFEGPALFGLGMFAGERQWFLQGELRGDDPAALGAPLALLGAPALKEHLGSRRFPDRPTAPSSSGSVTTTGPDPAWEASWQHEPSVTTWALGIASSRWLGAPRNRSLGETFRSWGGLCRGEPLLALGWQDGDLSVDAALSLERDQVKVDARVPLALLPAFLEVATSP